MLNELATIAAYSASASFGRDVYKSVKNGGLGVAFLAGALLTILGFRHMVMGHQRGVIGTFFLTIIGSLLMIGFGTVLAVLAIVGIGGYTGLINDTRGSLAGQIALVALIYIVVSSVIGLSWGFSNRVSRRKLREVQADNLSFLEENGFSDLGLGEDLIEDSDGNRLKLRAEEEGQLVFTVVGRRNVRAAIRLDEVGRMISYTGAIRI